MLDPMLPSMSKVRVIATKNLSSLFMTVSGADRLSLVFLRKGMPTARARLVCSLKRVCSAFIGRHSSIRSTSHVEVRQREEKGGEEGNGYGSIVREGASSQS